MADRPCITLEYALEDLRYTIENVLTMVVDLRVMPRLLEDMERVKQVYQDYLAFEAKKADETP